MSHYACRICRSIYKGDIEKLLYERLSFREIARKYVGIFNTDLHLLEQSIAAHYKRHLPRELTAYEKGFLRRLEQGYVDFDEMSRVIEKRAFENMLNNPKHAKFSHYFKLETLKNKRDRVRQRRIEHLGI